jgi:hypothetical protein
VAKVPKAYSAVLHLAMDERLQSSNARTLRFDLSYPHLHRHTVNGRKENSTEIMLVRFSAIDEEDLEATKARLLPHQALSTDAAPNDFVFVTIVRETDRLRFCISGTA